MSTSSNSTEKNKSIVEISTREAELRGLSLTELKSLYFKVTKKSSVFMVTEDSLIIAILQHEYPDYKPPPKKKSITDQDTTSTTTTTTTEKKGALGRENELTSQDINELRKTHFRLTKSSSLTLTKQDLIQTIMKQEHPKYMADKAEALKLEEEKKEKVKPTKKKKKKKNPLRKEKSS